MDTNSPIPPGKCLKCGRGVDDGYLLETGHGGARSVTAWVEGEPQRSIWMGLSLDGRARRNIRAVRCRNCGFLELYAP